MTGPVPFEVPVDEVRGLDDRPRTPVAWHCGTTVVAEVFETTRGHILRAAVGPPMLLALGLPDFAASVRGRERLPQQHGYWLIAHGRAWPLYEWRDSSTLDLVMRVGRGVSLEAVRGRCDRCGQSVRIHLSGTALR